MRDFPRLISAMILFLSVTKVSAQLEHCNDVLMGNLTNKIITSSSATSSHREILKQAIFRQTESEAFDLYKREYKNAIKQGQSGGVEFNIAVFGVGGEFATSYERELTDKEFSIAYNKLNEEYKSDVNQEKNTDTSLASSYASYIRDPESIKAWKDCVTRDAPPGVYAFGSRDESGTPFINVLWVAGPFAADNPSIEVTFAALGDITIATGRPKVEVALGSGESFLVQTKNPNAGFMVQVNGRRMKGDKVLNSFTAKAEIPPFPPPKPRQPAKPPQPTAVAVKAPGTTKLLDLRNPTGFPVSVKENRQIVELPNDAMFYSLTIFRGRGGINDLLPLTTLDVQLRDGTKATLERRAPPYSTNTKDDIVVTPSPLIQAIKEIVMASRSAGKGAHHTYLCDFYFRYKDGDIILQYDILVDPGQPHVVLTFTGGGK
jgi:hypothetical protein